MPRRRDGGRGRARQALLIEDAAHVLSPIGGVGEHGDFVIYSPRKLLPIPDGAFLVVRTPAAALVASVAAALESLGSRRAPTLHWRMQRSRLLRRFPRASIGVPSFKSDEESTPLARTPMMSELAAALIAKADLAAIAERRRRNAANVLAAVTHLPGWTPVFSLSGDWVAHRLPMRCASPDLAERYFDRFRGTGLPAETWPSLAPEISAGSGARRLRETVLLLPCHQHLDTANLAVS